MKVITKPKAVKLVNPLNGEIWFCKDYTDTRFIDGIEYIKVHKPDSDKQNLMRKDVLQRK